MKITSVATTHRTTEGVRFMGTGGVHEQQSHSITGPTATSGGLIGTGGGYEQQQQQPHRIE